jgi:hypothetical protein
LSAVYSIHEACIVWQTRKGARSLILYIASEPAQAPVDYSSLYHMDFMIACATRFNHVSEANHLSLPSWTTRTHISPSQHRCANHLTRQLDSLFRRTSRYELLLWRSLHETGKVERANAQLLSALAPLRCLIYLTSSDTRSESVDQKIEFMSIHGCNRYSK